MSNQDRAYYRIKEEPVTTCATCAENDAKALRRQRVTEIVFFAALGLLLGVAFVCLVQRVYGRRSA